MKLKDLIEYASKFHTDYMNADLLFVDDDQVELDRATPIEDMFYVMDNDKLLLMAN